MLTAFTAGLLLITISELGDKTFFMAVLLAMRHCRRLVFLGVVGALAAMTILSVLLGRAIAFLPKEVTHYAAIALFLIFGLKLLYTASKMSDDCNEEVVEEAKATLDAVGHQRLSNPAIVMQSFALTFVAEWGDRTQIATITLAAANNPVGVTLGAIVGHTICALIAVLCGRWIAGCISEKMVNLIGGVLFLVFAVVAVWEGA